MLKPHDKIEYSCTEYSRADGQNMHSLQPAWIMFSLILTLNLLHNSYREDHSNGAFVSSRSSLSPSRFSATFIMSLEMWCYERSLKKEKGLCNNVRPSTRISKALTSLQWPHVVRKLDHLKTMKHTARAFAVWALYQRKQLKLCISLTAS